MHGIAVTLLTENRERLSLLQHRLEATQLGRSVFSHLGFPVSATDPILRQIQDSRTEVVLVDIDSQGVKRATQAIELIRATTSDIAIFAIGEMSHPGTIVTVMRSGAGEYLDRDLTAEALVEALTHFANARNKNRTSAGRARVITVVNAKGGSGATSVAVNTAVALQETRGSVLLVDFATLGQAALQLNVRPSFGVVDALQNLHRMDASLLEGLMTSCKGGLQLLAGPQQPAMLTPNSTELARLFDLLVTHFRYVVVDCSNRIDQTGRLLAEVSNAVLLIAQADVVSLWSANRMRTFLEEGSGRNQVRLVLNRYKKIPGFTDEDVETATNCKLLWKLPNNYQAIAPAIDKGVPVAAQENHDLSRSFRGLASMLADASLAGEGALDLIYQPDKSDGKKKASGNLLISPLRAPQN